MAEEQSQPQFRFMPANRPSDVQELIGLIAAGWQYIGLFVVAKAGVATPGDPNAGLAQPHHVFFMGLPMMPVQAMINTLQEIRVGKVTAAQVLRAMGWKGE